MIKNTSMPKIGAFIVSVIVAGLFLSFVLKKPSIFNMLPFAIHEAINPGGTSEALFIIIFDIAIALLLFVFSYRVAYKLLIKKQ